MYIDHIKLFAINKKELEAQIQSVRIYSQDIGMQFGIKNGTTKSRKNENACRKGNLRIIENIGS